MRRSRTRYVADLEPAPCTAGADPSPLTALGVFESTKAAADRVFGGSLAGLTVLSIIDAATRSGRCPGQIADHLAQEVIGNAGRKAA